MTVPKGYAWLQCRALGHAWDVVFWGKPTDATVALPDLGGYYKLVMVRQTQCLRCPMLREEFFRSGAKDPSETWAVIHRRYRNNTDYVVKGGMNRREANAALYRRIKLAKPKAHGN